MTVFKKISPIISLTMLVAFSMVLFVVPTSKAQALDTQTHLCVNRSSTFNNLMNAFVSGSGNQCPSGWDFYDAPSADRGLCLGPSPIRTPIQTLSPKSAQIIDLSPDGTKCYYDTGQVGPGGEPVVDEWSFVTFTTIKETYNPNPNTNGNGNTNGNQNNNGNGNSSGNGNGNSGGTNGNYNSPPQSQGDCENGFHKSGPICVPNSPFNSGIAGDPSSQTAAGLAIRIVRMLLYFAGIVAVIMAIVGGYQIMTAAGNATQAGNGRKTLTNAIIGLVIVIMSYVIINAVISFITK